MNPTTYHQELVLRGLSSIEATPSASERIAFLNAAADLLQDEELSVKCRVTARVLQEAEDAQLRLFNSIRPDP